MYERNVLDGQWLKVRYCISSRKVHEGVVNYPTDFKAVFRAEVIEIKGIDIKGAIRCRTPLMFAPLMCGP